MANRNILSEKIMTELTGDMRSFGVKVINVSIENIDFTDAFTDAVEAKQVAEQQKLKAAIEQDQLTLEAEAEAKRAILKAESDLEVAKMEAESNEVLSASFSDKLLEYYYIQRWDGKLHFPGDDIPIIKGTALGALESPSNDPNAPEYACIHELMDAVDTYIPTPARDDEKPFLMPIESLFEGGKKTCHEEA